MTTRKQVFKEYKLTEQEINDHSTLTNPNYWQHPIDKCRFLYSDGDGGLAVISFSEIFEDDGFQIELIDCAWFDIDFYSLSEIRKRYILEVELVYQEAEEEDDL